MSRNINNKGLEDILYPITKEDFFENYYEKKVCLIKRNNLNYFKELLNVAHLDDYMTNSTIQYPKIRMVDYNRELKSDSYTNTNGTINATNAIKEFHNGATLVFSGLHDHLENMKFLVDNVSKDYWQKLQTNIYFTPPNSQGFQAHYDTHDVFVIQTSGSKKWYIFENDEMYLPLKSQSFEADKYNSGNIVQEFILDAGDTLYIPRGVFHSAETQNSHSIHITMGLLAVTWSDLLVENVIHLAKNIPELRRNVPFHRNNEVDNQIAMEKLLDLVKANTLYRKNEKRFKKDLIQNQVPTLKNQLVQIGLIDDIDENTEFYTRTNLLFIEKVDSKEVELFIMGNKLKFPAFTLPIIDFIKNSKATFNMNDLPDIIDDKGKIAIIKRLVKEGLLIINNIKKNNKNETNNISMLYA
jgi:ribosomal protein L16 Arg81 hydroxylase